MLLKVLQSAQHLVQRKGLEKKKRDRGSCASPQESYHRSIRMYCSRSKFSTSSSSSHDKNSPLDFFLTAGDLPNHLTKNPPLLTPLNDDVVVAVAVVVFLRFKNKNRPTQPPAGSVEERRVGQR